MSVRPPCIGRVYAGVSLEKAVQANVTAESGRDVDTASNLSAFRDLRIHLPLTARMAE